MSFEAAIKGIGCGGFITELLHQNPSVNSKLTAAVPLSFNVRNPIDVRKPIEDWHPVLPLWRCGNFGQKRGKPRQYCPNFVDDDYGLEHASSRCLPCRQRGRKNKIKNWPSLMVKDSRRADKCRLQLCDEKRKFVCIDWNKYITKEYLLSVYEMVKGKCWWCGVKMDTKNRRALNGLTVDRLDDRPHYIGSCTLACSSCNSTSWREPNKKSFFMDQSSLQRCKLRFFRMYYTGWERFQKLHFGSDSRPR